MTGDHAESPTGRREKQPLGWRVATPVMVLVIGSLFAISAVDSQGTDLRPGRYTDLTSLAEADRADWKRLQEERTALEEEVDDLTGQVSGEQVSKLRTSAARLRDPAGRTPRSGPGVTVALSDSPEDVFDAAKDYNKTVDADQKIPLNELVVHQQDIQAVVNALWVGGAKAVTVAGQRVVSTTGIKCEGSVVQIHGVPYPQPFVIRAVGDPVALERSVLDDSWVAGYIAASESPTRQIGWDLEYDNQIEAPAYEGVIDRQYAEPIS